jgi:ribonuclease HII
MAAPETERRARGRKPLVYRGDELHCTRALEDQAHADGYAIVAGMDEVGRGALCGPVVACVVVLGDGFDSTGVDDSKRLTAKQREELSARVRDKAAAFSVGVADPREIDRLNILRATHLAMVRAVQGLGIGPDVILVDALTVPGVATPQRPDEMMRECDRRYPGYGLAHNMGYASDDHRQALRRLGPSEIHRRSFHGTQRWLF